MTKEEALANIGHPFKVIDSGMKWDIIREVKEDGEIIGDFVDAYCGDCRLKMEQPEHLKRGGLGA